MEKNKSTNYNKINGLAKKPEKNKGITSKKDFADEADLQDFLQKWLKGKKLHRHGYNRETSKSKKRDKKEESQITKVEKEPNRASGFGDIAIHHNSLDLSWNHKLSNPFIIELKHPKKFRKAAHQAVMYKGNSDSKYQEENGFKYCQTGIATTRSLSTGEIATASDPKKTFSADYDAKRIYWDMKVGVTQSVKPDEVIISFGEADKVLIK